MGDSARPVEPDPRSQPQRQIQPLPRFAPAGGNRSGRDFRRDADAPVRQPHLGSRTPVLHHDGRDLAAALQIIIEIGDPEALQAAISDAFPGARLNIAPLQDGWFAIEFYQEGLLRPLSAAELSDGTLRYLRKALKTRVA